MPIIRFFSLSLLRGGLVRGVLFLTFLSIMVCFALSDIDMGDHKQKLFLDLLLVFEAFWMHALALLWAFELGKNEQLLKLSRLPLSTALTRSRYEMCRFASIIAAFMPVALLLFAVNLIFAPLFVVWQSILYALSALTGAFLVLALSRFFAPVSAVLYSTALIMIGNGLDELYIYAHKQFASAFVRGLSETLFVILPNFSLFDHQSEAVNGVLMSKFAFFGLPPLYALVISLALIALSVWKFRRSVI
ncbi:MAG: hypothetical protein LBE89_04445 [Helicobacteraceae bacterium]|nr:hypothetical protein [Helicobacteraceae bacterium]